MMCDQYACYNLLPYITLNGEWMPSSRTLLGGRKREPSHCNGKASQPKSLQKTIKNHSQTKLEKDV